MLEKLLTTKHKNMPLNNNYESEKVLKNILLNYLLGDIKRSVYNAFRNLHTTHSFLNYYVF